jgi:hypothetical protein
MTVFVAKSSTQRTRVLRGVTGRLTIRRLVNINPGRPRTSSTAAPRKPQHHHFRSPRSESKSFFFLKRAHGIVEQAIKEAGEEEVPLPLPTDVYKCLHLSHSFLECYFNIEVFHTLKHVRTHMHLKF